ncbi:hypothetical protein TOPH_03775 [Tolypocladium ophioglossoides CBS 100239]|uniref:Uncharacterized protein n=1 Tax=Tolypocladium ophioglossoides (strain CBS 100239) TaxID=1163406 RepID=A0A0L0NBP0_TOLOC|nr:hypothetical protein TOPH_03775 [Tolypocladium ophioglossoides CBS 100239]
MTGGVASVLRRPSDLRKRETALDALKELARHLVAHDMTFFAVVQLLARATLMDADHGDADGPGGLADAEAEVAVVGVDVATLLEGLDDFDDGLDEGGVEVAGFELAEELVLPKQPLQPFLVLGYRPVDPHVLFFHQRECRRYRPLCHHRCQLPIPLQPHSMRLAKQLHRLPQRPELIDQILVGHALPPRPYAVLDVLTRRLDQLRQP